MRRWRLLALLLAPGSCGDPETGPLPIAPGEDACDLCRMIISELPHAAQARFEGGRVEKYDDIGCLAERLRGGGARPVEVWVIDRPTGGWTDGRSAAYVRSKTLKTPMASGLAAYRDAAAAAKEGGERLSFDHMVGQKR